VELLLDRSELGRAFEGARDARATLTWSEAAQAHERLYEELALPARAREAAS
jgi:hypothetical protein